MTDDNHLSPDPRDSLGCSSARKRKLVADADDSSDPVLRSNKREKLLGKAGLLLSLKETPSLYQHTRLPQRGNFIRLLNIQPGTAADNLHIILTAETFDLNSEEPASYEALSYVWGSTADEVLVQVGLHKEASLGITPNLADALRHLRYEDRPRCMWIDAICIDQKHVQERSAQVAIMKKIYERASRVVVWLGLANRHTLAALNALERVGKGVDEQLEAKTVHTITEIRNATNRYADEPIHFTDIEEDAIKDLMFREWFLRLWIRQEVASAEGALLQSGPHSISWKHFRLAIIYMNGKSFHGDPRRFRSHNLHVIEDVCTTGVPYSIKTLRVRLHGTECSEPKDRIYAVLSMLNESDNDLFIMPDYSKSTAEVYQELTLEYLSQYRSLGLLLSCEWRADTKVPGLPSWVPDWSTDLNLLVESVASSSGSMFRAKSEYLGEGVLRVAGVECCTVACAQALNRSNLEAVVTSVRQFWFGISPEGGLEKRYYGSGELINAFARTLLWNRFQESHIERPSLLIRFDSFKNKIHSWVKSNVEDSTNILQDMQSQQYAAVIKSVMYGAVFYTTSSGQIGAAPEATEPNDRIVTLLGCESPIMVRPVEDGRFLVIGPCYLAGAMSAESLLGPLTPGVQQVMCRGGDIACLYQKTDEVTFEDPRFEKLGVDMTEQRLAWEQGLFRRLDPDFEDFRRIGIDVRYIDLI
ncbi:Heterokaryon incompatibility protein [Paramyrothecium foliicola]|nr:Heterokaryon incompatibility protein [Paramyrothecium foliicola]